MLTIYSAQGVKLLEISSIGTGSKGYYSLMQHDYIVLNFSLDTPIDFGIGSYVDLTGQFDDALGGKLSKKYYVTEKQTPTYNTTTGGYDYELRLNAYYWLWNNYIFKYTHENAGSEASWSLTAALDVHLGVFLRNLASLGFTFNGQAYTYSIDGTVQNKAVAMTYDNVHLLDALFSLGGKDYYDCDVWITENVIHFGRCELGTSVKIERGVEAQDITRSDSKGTFATRIYAFGSTRNIPTNYRPVDEQMVVNGVVQKRLMLPQGTPYIDAYPNMSQTEVIEDIVVFDDIYPRRVGTLQNVTSRTETVENEDGTQSTYTYYRYKDSGLTFDEDYILKGQNLQVTFQSGKLNGMTFGVTFNPDGASPAEQLWEIVGNEDYGRFLPDETIKPEDGDEYILSGFNIQLVSDQYIPAAEQELLQKAQEYVNKTKVDDGTYTATLRSDWVFADQIHRTFDVGQKITLVAPDFFTDNRVSRVIGWEMNLDIPYDSPIYTIGESAQYSRLNDIEEKVDTVTFRGNTYTGIGGSGVYVVRTNDRTSPSDSNVFSALRSLSQFLRKDKEDSTRYLLSLFGGAVFGADGFAGGMSGFGARIDDGGNGEMESLTVRRELTVPQLTYNRVDIKVGDKWRAPGGGVIASVDTSAKRCTLRLEEGEIGAVAVGDICMGIFHSEVSADNAAEDMDDGLGNRTFAGFTTVYFRITGVEGERNEAFTYELRPVSERWTGQAEPFAEMQFVAYGSFTDEERQTSVYETRTYTRMLWKQNTWEIGVENIALQYGDLSNLGVFGMEMDGYSAYLNSVYFTGTLTQVKPDGTPVRTANDRGAWEAGKYDYYDRVSHDGCIWLCVAEDGTESEPSKSSADWLLQVDKGADGTPGEPGKDGTGIEVKGSVKAHFKNFAALTAGGTGAQDGDKFILDDSSDYSETSQGETQEGYAAPSVMGYWNMPDFTWSVAKAAAGDCFTDEAEGHMWVAGETAWTDAGKVKGDDGAEGDGGVSISLSGSPLAINASEINAEMTGTLTWTARIRVYQGAEQTAVTGITLDSSYGSVVTATVDGGEGVVTFTANSENWGAALLYAAVFFTNGGIPFTVAYTDKGGEERTADGVVGVSLVQNGADGAPGKNGCAVRASEWAEGVEYRNDEGLATDGVRYLDVAMVRNDAAETGWDAYECLKTHTSSADLTYTNTEYWRKFGANVGAIFTSLIIAKNAKIRFLQGNSITVEKEDGTVTAGMQGSAEGKKTRLWAGSSVPDDAPFRVDEDGKMTATDAEVNGIIHSRLTYSSVKRLTMPSEDYTIDPSVEPFNTLFIITSRNLFVTLPNADEYEGLELNIYQSVVTRAAMGTVVIKTAASPQEIYYSASTALINGVIVQTVNTEANHAESLVLTPNIVVRLLAVDGNWYMLVGALTGE